MKKDLLFHKFLKFLMIDSLFYSDRNEKILKQSLNFIFLDSFNFYLPPLKCPIAVKQ